MSPVGVFYGSSSGITENIAGLVLDSLNIPDSEIFDVAECNHLIPGKFNNLVFGASTWGIGALQEDMQIYLRKLDFSILKNSRISLFGTGDAGNYPYTFVDGLGIMFRMFKIAELEIVGDWDDTEYDFYKSLAFSDGKFQGLVIDIQNQPELTTKRVEKWTEKIRKDFL